MAVPLSPEDVAQDDDQQKLALAQSYYTMSESAAWRDLVDKIEGLVKDAENEFFKSRDVDPMRVLEGKLLWQQRMLVKQAILYIVQGQLDLREQITEEMKETDEYTSANAE